MATNKVITVTVIPTRTGDTVASYNAYSSVDGLLGSLSVAEAAAGKTFSLSDGASHNITVKTVWTTEGESTTNVSNIVVVDLSSVSAPEATNMLLWYDATDAATIEQTTASGRVSKWVDKTAGATGVTDLVIYAITEDATSEPYTGTQTINGLNTIDFQGAQSLYRSYSIKAQPNTEFMIVRFDTIPIENKYVRSATDAVDRNILYTRDGNAIRVNGGNDITHPVTLAVDTDYLFVVHYNGASSFANINGTNDTTDLGIKGNEGIMLGSTFSDVPLYGLDGRIGEFLSYNGALTLAQINTTANYLASKWGLTWTDLT